jgi:dTDP-4-amino-4,6-dideoxygalactose transaminase
VSNPSLKIPIVDLRAQYASIRDQVRSAIDRVAESQQFILGPAVAQFEAEMAGFLGCEHAVGVASGSDALLLALMALGVGPGDAVITTPFTFFSTVSSITRLGARPLLVDIDSDSYLLSGVMVG